ncbi:MAG: hypothetical protein ACRD15_13465 [Vicinamibacterales bacterium]
MIQPLRRAHRYVIAALAIVLPLVLAAAILLREDPAVQRNWPFRSAVEGRP